MNTKYKTVVVIGYGVVTGHVLQTVYEASGKYRYDTIYVEHEEHPFNQAKKYADKNGIQCEKIPGKEDLLAFFSGIIEHGKLLVISASNNYIFPAELVNRSEVDIVNFHNALLPNYPGRNAPSWVIYNAEKETGITWHYVSSGIDTGDVIIQKKTSIDPGIKAYELTAILMDLAANAFDEVYESILTENAARTGQVVAKDRVVYKSYEIPNDGFFDIRDNAEFIYRLLRATDYGKNNIFPKMRTVLNGQTIQIRRYRIVDDKSTAKGDYNYFIPYEDKYILLKYEIVYSDVEMGGNG